MPPRFAYWTILIDQQPTAFRARDREDLLPTLKQLSHTNKDVVLKWFARGRLWDTPDQERWARTNLPEKREQRAQGWRPGGSHQDPRARFDRRNRDRSGHHGAPIERSSQAPEPQNPGGKPSEVGNPPFRTGTPPPPGGSAPRDREKRPWHGKPKPFVPGKHSATGGGAQRTGQRFKDRPERSSPGGRPPGRGRWQKPGNPAWQDRSRTDRESSSNASQASGREKETERRKWRPGKRDHPRFGKPHGPARGVTEVAGRKPDVPGAPEAPDRKSDPSKGD
jgi:hypothetical protein